MYTQFATIFAFMLIGFVLKKLNVIPDSMMPGFTSVIMKFVLPAFLIDKMSHLSVESGIMKEFMATLGLTIALYAFYAVVAYFYCKLRRIPPNKSNVMEACMTTNNSGICGMPIAEIFYGPMGVALMGATNFFLHFYMFGYGILLMERNEMQGKSKRKVFLFALKKLANPNIISIIIGLSMCALGIQLPDFFDGLLIQCSSLCVPLSMIFVGANLAMAKFSEIIKDAYAIEGTIFKLLALPAITMVVCLLLPITPLMTAILVLSAAMPTAIALVPIANDYGQDAVFASKIVFFSTALSMATILLVLFCNDVILFR